jgi:hypothetical protein
LDHDAHPQTLRLIGELVSHAAKGPLVQLLVGCGTHIQMLADRAHIANDQLLDALLVQRVDQIAGLLVLDILDLMRELAQPLLLGSDQFPAPPASLLAVGNLRVQLRDELVAVLPLTAQQAPIEQVSAFPIAGDRRMDLPQVDAHAVLSAPFLQGQLLFLREVCPDPVGRNGFVLAPRPVDDDGLGKIPLPEQDQRGVPTTIGEDEQALVQPHGAALVLDLEEPLAAARWFGVGVHGVPLAPAGKPGKERLYCCIHAMGMQQMIRIARDEPHQLLGFEPDAFVPYRAPEEEQRLTIDLPTRMSQFIELGCSAELNPAHSVLRVCFRPWFPHTDLFFVACLKPERPGLKLGKTRLSARPLRHGGLRRVYCCQTCDFLRCKTTTIPTISSVARITAPLIQAIAEFVVLEVCVDVDVTGVNAVAVAAVVVVTLSDS